MNKYLSVIIIITLIIIIYLCNNIENFTTSTQPITTSLNTLVLRRQIAQPAATGPEVTGPEVTSPEVTGPEVTGPEATDPSATDPVVTDPETLRKSFNRQSLYEYMSRINSGLSFVLNLQNQNYITKLSDEEIGQILNELKDEFNQKNIISESVIDISQRLQDRDIKKLKEDIDELRNKIPEIQKSNFVKHISTGKIFEILNDSNNNQYLEINKDLNLCLSHKHNKLTDNDIQKMIDDKKEIENINLEHCDFDSDKQYIYLSNEIKNKDENNPQYNKPNSQFNDELHESCKQYGSLSENSKLNNYPFYHLYPEDYDNNLDLKDKKYCLTVDDENLSIEKCSGKNSQRFLKV